MSSTDGPATFNPADDGLHSHLAHDEWWFTETVWFSFHDVERRLGGWFYTLIRPTIGTVSGGAWVWDDNAHLPWEVPYSTNYTALELPNNLDLTNGVLPNGISIKVEEPTSSYRIGYDDPGRYRADLLFEAAMPARPLVGSNSTFGKAAHFDQFGHVTGAIELHGETIEIDCWSIRDRTWGRRPEDRPRQAAYVTGAGEEGAGFLAVTNTRDGTDRIAYGFIRRGSEAVTLTGGQRTVERDPEQGWVTAIEIEAVDENGDTFVARGRSLSRIITNRHSFIDVNSLIRWELVGDNGVIEWIGEDQDMWPVHRWAAAKRANDWSIPR